MMKSWRHELIKSFSLVCITISALCSWCFGMIGRLIASSWLPFWLIGFDLKLMESIYRYCTVVLSFSLLSYAAEAAYVYRYCSFENGLTFCLHHMMRLQFYFQYIIRMFHLRLYLNFEAGALRRIIGNSFGLSSTIHTVWICFIRKFAL